MHGVALGYHLPKPTLSSLYHPAMTELVGNWLHFAAQQPKRKRAEAVCFFCHSKKIKCDLQVNLPHAVLFRMRPDLVRTRAEAPKATHDAPTVTTRTKTATFGRLREASSAEEYPLKQNAVLSLLSSWAVSHTLSLLSSEPY